MLKRLFDIFLSSIGIIGSSFLWLLFSLAIKLEDRAGGNGRAEKKKYEASNKPSLIKSMKNNLSCCRA